MTNPLQELADWREAARGKEPEPDAMIVATATPDGAPSARVVLCRGIDAGVCFYTNYHSRKGGELAHNSKAAAVFFWPTFGRQVRLEGTVAKVTPAASDRYFHSRPRGHQLGAWASPQSQVIGSLDEVKQRHAELTAKYEGQEVPRPPHWGGYRLTPRRVELWQAGENRLHSRRVFEREGEGWTQTLLGP